MPQPLFFNQIKFIPSIEVAIHRGLWSFIFLLILIIFLGKINIFLNIFKSYKKISILSLTAILISINWTGFIYAVSIHRVQDASMGYFISPMISIGLGYFFLNEKISTLKLISIFMMFIALIVLIISSETLPFLAILIALSWSIYGLLRKRINISPEIGLLYESGFISLLGTPYLIYLYFQETGFFLNNSSTTSLLLIITGLITIFPLFFFNLGVKSITLGFAGVIFYIAPSFHFITSIFILNESMNFQTLISFIIIWIAVIIFIIDVINREKKLSRVILNY